MNGTVRLLRSTSTIVLSLLLLTRIASAQEAAPAAPPPGWTPEIAPPPLPAALPTEEAPKPDPKPVAPRHKTAKSLASRLDWKWPRFGWPQFGITVGQTTLAIASVAIPGLHNWSGGNAFDDAARDALRLPDLDSSLHARDASDVGLVLLLNQQLVDTLFVTWWFHDKGTTALQMALIDAQTLTFAAGVQQFAAGLIGRERPYGRSICEGDTDIAKSSDCLGSNRQRSFFSGHATLSFALAGLTCAHHINLPLYGGGPAEAVPCAATLALATGVSLLRVVSDQHYISDVLAGSAFGLASGFAIPYLFHYMYKPAGSTGIQRALGLGAVSVLPTLSGLQAGGEF